MKAIHLYIGVLLGCAALIGTGKSVIAGIADVVYELRTIKTEIADLKRTTAAQSSELQALRADLNGVKLETNTYMAYQDGLSRTERRTTTTPKFPATASGIQ